MKKIIRNKELQKATRKFTDREQPRKVFWDEYRKLEQNLKNDEDIHVITYYGVGGIGKSTLLRKITKELEEEKALFAFFDFETAQDAKTVLTLIKNQLEQKAAFQFPIFDLALYTYARKIGENTDKPEVKSLVEKSKPLSFLVDVLNEIPLIGMASTLFKLADSGLAIIKNNKTKYKSDLIRLESETPEETYKRLPYYFSQDLATNLEKADKPLVILLDTYEKLVNEIKAEGYSLMQDAWLRSDEGPILQVPGVLWILAGREKIKWGEYDKDWEETLNQHILGDLSFKDANDFLQEAGIEEETLRKKIYDLTHGTPVYLDICVSTYEILKENGEAITINKFGKNVDVLVERFIRYMDAQSSEIAYVLSQIGNWTDELIQEVGYKILPNFSLTLYEKIKGLSFIFCENGKYYMHKTVRDILRRECPDIICQTTMGEMENYYGKYLMKQSVLDKDYISNIDNYFNAAVINFVLTEDEDIISSISQVIDHLLKKFLVDRVDQNLNYIYPLLKKDYADVKSMYILDLDYSDMLIRQGKTAAGIKLYEKVLQEMMAKKGFDFLCLQRIAINMNHYRTIATNKKLASDFLNYVKNYDLKKVERHDEPGFMNIIYNIEANLCEVLSLYEEAFDLYLKASKGNEDNAYRPTMSILSVLSLMTQHDIFYKSTECVELIEKMIAENSTIDPNYFNAMLTLTAWYVKKIKNSEKALYWVNQAEEYYHKMYGDDHVFDSEDNLIRSKLVVLDMANKPELKSYAEAMQKIVVENYNSENIEVELLLIKLLEYIDLKERRQLIEKLYQKYTQGKVNINNIYKIAYELTKTDEGGLIQKFVDTIYGAIEKEGLNENNINIYQNVLRCVNYINNNSIAKDYDYLEQKIDNCIKYYQDKYGSDSDMVLGAMKQKADFYLYIGEYEKAIAVFEKQYDICKKQYGEDSLECANINNNIAYAYSNIENEDNPEKTIMYFQKALQTFKKLFGENDPRTLKVEKSLLTVLPFNEDKLKKLQKYYAKIVSLVGENDKLAMEVLDDIGFVCVIINHYEEALQTYLKLYDLTKKEYGETADITMEKINNIADAYLRLEDYSNALPYYQKMYQFYKEKYGENDEKTIDYMDILGDIYLMLDDCSNALPNYQKLYPIYMDKYGEDGDDTIRIMSRLAEVYFELKDYSNALPYYEKLYPIYKDKYGENDEKTTKLMFKLATVYLELENYSNALTYYEKIYPIYLEKYGENDADTIEIMYKISQVYLGLKDYAKILPYYEKMYQIYLKEYGEMAELTLRQQQYVAMIHKFMKNYAKELELREKNYPKLMQIYSENDDELLAAYDRIAQAHYNLKDYAKALEKHLHLYSIYKEKYGEEDDKTLDILEWLDVEYYHLEQFEKEQEINEKRYQIYLKKYGEKHDLTISTLKDQVTSLLFLGKYKEALEIILKLLDLFAELAQTKEQEKYIKLGVICYEKEKKYKEALQFLEKWLPYMENETRRLIEKAHVYYQMKDIEEAKKIINSISLKKMEKESCENLNDIRYLNDLADVLIACQKEKEAKVVMKKIMAIIDTIWSKFDIHQNVTANLKKLNMKKTNPKKKKS